ncbi:MAG: EVE domain-containing protein [Gammaproteobacteria bacterium]
MNYWLFKSEPSEFSIDDLANKKGRREHWDGVRNYQARNFMRDKMRIGDLGFFYHSSCAQPAIVGIVRVVREAYPDHTAFDPTDKHFDEKSDPDAPRWFMVDVEFVEKLKQPITLQTLKACKNSAMSDFALTRRGNRLSIMPVTKQQWKFISEL